MEKMIIDIIRVIFLSLSFLLHFVSSLSVPNSRESRLLGFLGWRFWRSPPVRRHVPHPDVLMPPWRRIGTRPSLAAAARGSPYDRPVG